MSTPSTDPTSATEKLQCPKCGKQTRSLKCYDLPVLVFLVLYFVSSFQRVVACRHCMRGAILKWCLGMIPASNIFWPFLFVWYTILFLATFKKGHTRNVEEFTEKAMADQACPQQEIAPNPSMVRVLVVLCILGAIVATIVIFSN